jgi:hypothetical protein
MADRLVIFLHLPKAAGSTLTRVIGQQYRRGEIRNLGGKDRAVALQEAADLTRPPAQIRIITGHVPFGVHRAVHGEFTYITLLRDPVDRLLSHFHFARQLASHPMHGDIASGKLTVLDVARRLANMQTRYLAGPDAEADNASDAARLARAKENLSNHFSVAGVVERFDEALMLMQRRLGWKVRAFTNSNVGRARSKKAADAGERAAIRALNPQDQELYEWVAARFEEDLAREGSGVQAAVNWLRLKNRVLHWSQQLRSLPRSLRQPAA